MLGGIPLKNLTVIEKDVNLEENDSCPLPRSEFASCIVSTTNSLPHAPRKTSLAGHHRNRIVLVTAMGVRYELEASSPDERDSWASYIRVASKLV